MANLQRQRDIEPIISNMPNTSDGSMEDITAAESDARSEASYDIVGDDDSANTQTSNTRHKRPNEDPPSRSNDTPDMAGSFQDLKASAMFLARFGEALQEVTQLVENAPTDEESDISELKRQLQAMLKEFSIELGDDTNEKIETLTGHLKLWRDAHSKAQFQLRDESEALWKAREKLDELSYCLKLWKKSHNRTVMELGDERKARRNCSEQLISAQKQIESARRDRIDAEKDIAQLEHERGQDSLLLKVVSEKLQKANSEIGGLRFQVGRLEPHCENLTRDLLEIRKESHEIKLQTEQRVARLEAKSEDYRKTLDMVAQERDNMILDFEKSNKDRQEFIDKIMQQVHANKKDFEAQKSKLADEIKSLKAQIEETDRIRCQTADAVSQTFEAKEYGLHQMYNIKLVAATKGYEALKTKLTEEIQSSNAQLEAKDEVYRRTVDANRDYAAIQDNIIKSLQTQLKFRDQIRKDLNDDLHKAKKTICDLDHMVKAWMGQADVAAKALQEQLCIRGEEDSTIKDFQLHISTLEAEIRLAQNKLREANINYRKLYIAIGEFFDRLEPINLAIDNELEEWFEETDSESQSSDQDEDDQEDETGSARNSSKNSVDSRDLSRLRHKTAKALEKADMCERTICFFKDLSKRVLLHDCDSEVEDIKARLATQTGQSEKYKTMLEETKRKAETKAADLSYQATEAEEREKGHHTKSNECYEKHKEYLKKYTDACTALGSLVTESSEKEKTKELKAWKERYAGLAREWWASATAEVRNAEREKYKSEHLKAEAAAKLEEAKSIFGKPAAAEESKGKEAATQEAAELPEKTEVKQPCNEDDGTTK